MGKTDIKGGDRQVRGRTITTCRVMYRDRMGNERYLYLVKGTDITIVGEKMRAGRKVYRLDPEMLPDGGVVFLEASKIELIGE